MYRKLNDTQLIPEVVYDNLPLLLKEACSQFTDPRERDVFLTSALGILSGCFTDVKGKYNKDIVHPNLFTMIVAPPGSGKQVMKYAMILAKPLHDKYMYDNDQQEITKQKEKIEEVAVSAVKVDVAKPEVSYSHERKVLIIPGNTSAAMIYQHLKTNKGIGIICETETDTLSNSIKQDWGNYSDLLRKSFHHERLSISRKQNLEYYEIDNPRLSVVLTGTPGQIGNLIGSSEDGLMSRFMFYVYDSELEWRSQKPCDSCADLGDFMNRKAEQVMKIAEDLKKSHPLFALSQSQFDQLDKFFEGKVEEMKMFGLQHMRGTINRLGLIAFRICMVLSVLRSADRLGKGHAVTCEDIDVTNALQLADTYFYHAIEAYNLLPKNQLKIQNPGMSRFYRLLPKDEFTTGVAEELGKTVGIADRTVRNYLKELVLIGVLGQRTHGHYQRTETEEHQGKD